MRAANFFAERQKLHHIDFELLRRRDFQRDPEDPAKLERHQAEALVHQSPLGMELLATVDWLLVREGRQAELEDVKEGLSRWPGGRDAGERKLAIFDDRLVELALDRLKAC